MSHRHDDGNREIRIGMDSRGETARSRERRLASRYGVAILLASALLAGTACQTVPEPAEYEVPTNATLAETEYAVTIDSEIKLIYLFAWNCPPCFRYERKEYREWVASEASRHVEFKKLKFARYQNTRGDRGWPEDLRWVRMKTDVRHGAPRFILLVDDQVVSNYKGRKSGWKPTVELIEELVNNKMNARKS